MPKIFQRSKNTCSWSDAYQVAVWTVVQLKNIHLQTLRYHGRVFLNGPCCPVVLTRHIPWGQLEFYPDVQYQISKRLLCVLSTIILFHFTRYSLQSNIMSVHVPYMLRSWIWPRKWCKLQARPAHHGPSFYNQVLHPNAACFHWHAQTQSSTRRLLHQSFPRQQVFTATTFPCVLKNSTNMHLRHRNWLHQGAAPTWRKLGSPKISWLLESIWKPGLLGS